MFRSYRARGGGKGAQCHACRFPLTLCWRTVYREQMDEWYGNEQEALEREDILYKEVQCVWVKAVQRFVTACMIVGGIGAGTGVSTLGAMVLEVMGCIEYLPARYLSLPSLKRTCLKHEIFNAYLSTAQEIRKLPSTKKYLLTSPSPNPTGASVPTRRSSRNERDTLHISNLPLLTSMDRLPAEIVDLIFRNIASPGTGLRHIAPFLRCGRRWFEHAVPFVWKRVCLLAITQECIDNKRRALYASQIETLTGWDGRKCGCGLCQANDPPNSQPRQYLLPHVDLTSIYRLPFPKLRQIQHMRFNDPTLPEMIERLHTADGNTITRLEVSQWHVESALPDFVSLLTNLSQLRVDHLAYHHDEVSVVQPAWDKLTSASMFRNLTYGCDESAMIIHALSDCPELSRLRITIEPAISSLLSPLPPNHADWYKRRGQPFRSLTKLDIRPMRECTSLYQELATMSALNSLTVRFRPASISPAILTLPGVYALTPGQGSRQHMLESIARNNQEIEELVLDASLRLPAASSSWRPPPPNSTRHDTGKSMKITLHSISIPREGEPGPVDEGVAEVVKQLHTIFPKLRSLFTSADEMEHCANRNGPLRGSGGLIKPSSSLAV
ncbi:hypothetical protein CGMCC3_g18057 [Colletotrichum fructicola]|nr:uncharacterized protein CGMCC3_g18057 [Colletotrichum fructicola]KAE9565761.1 hypothetical protein CGMCC3_g18057 [Colletotrichum fructicola]